METGPLPTISLLVALTAGLIAGASRKSDPEYGALAGAVVRVLGSLLQVPPSATGAYLGGAAMVSMMAAVEGVIWGGIWGAVGGFIGRKMARVK